MPAGFPWRRRWVGLLICFVLWLVFLAATTNFSHDTPYIRDAANSAAAPPLAALDSQEATALDVRLLLVGDAGYATSETAPIAGIAERARLAPDRTTVLFLGDNIYPRGLPPADDPTRARSEAHLLAQLDPLRGSGAEIVFVPGNHDWDHSSPDGAEAVKRQEAFVREHGTARTQYLPKAAQPGPECLDRGRLRLVILDTEWWLTEPSPSEQQQQQVTDAIGRCIAGAGERHVVVLAHHPWITHGRHGGFQSVETHVFPFTDLEPKAYIPLPIIGSLYPLVRDLGVSAQDQVHRKNKHMRERLGAAMQNPRPLLYASGHDHSIQLDESDSGPRFSLVSGAGSKPTAVYHGDSTLFAVATSGFVELDVKQSGAVVVKVYLSEQGQPARLTWVKQLLGG